MWRRKYHLLCFVRQKPLKTSPDDLPTSVNIKPGRTAWFFAAPCCCGGKELVKKKRTNNLEIFPV